MENPFSAAQAARRGAAAATVGRALACVKMPGGASAVRPANCRLTRRPANSSVAGPFKNGRPPVNRHGLEETEGTEEKEAAC